MLKSVLLHLEGATEAEAVIRLGVSVAFPLEARVRGLTLVDTRGVESALENEAAIYAVTEQSRQATTKREQIEVRALLSQACLDAGLNFDVRQGCGNPLRLLPREARFHDLVVTSVACHEGVRETVGLKPRDLIELLQRGVQPLLVVQPGQSSLSRVLMVYDGSDASGRAIRSFLSMAILPKADHRLLAVGRDEGQARTALREMADYCLARRPSLETGYLAGRPQRVLLPYAEKWQPDLLVMGVDRGSFLWRRLSAGLALDLWRKLKCGLFVTT